MTGVLTAPTGDQGRSHGSPIGLTVVVGPPNQLFYGDNLPVLRQHVKDESVDLIYLDPPFNSNRAYNVLFKSHSGEESQAQIEAFDDTWHWSGQAEQQYRELIEGGAPVQVADVIEARTLAPSGVRGVVPGGHRQIRLRAVVNAVTGTPRASLLKTVAALPRPRSARPSLPR